MTSPQNKNVKKNVKKDLPNEKTPLLAAMKLSQTHNVSNQFMIATMVDENQMVINTSSATITKKINGKLRK